MTSQINISTQARVSLIARLVPSLAFASCAASGAIGGVLILQLLEVTRATGTDGLGSFFAKTSEIGSFMGLMLCAAATIGAIAIFVEVIRMFTPNKTASPSGAWFLIVGLFSLAPPFLVHFILHLLEGTARHPEEGGIWSIETTLTALCYFGVAIAVIAVFILLAFTFIPFSSGLGRKLWPTICLFIIEILIIFLAGIFFFQANRFLD